jgi:hypothetical protein
MINLFIFIFDNNFLNNLLILFLFLFSISIFIFIIDRIIVFFIKDIIII